MKQRKILKTAIIFIAICLIGIFTKEANATELKGHMGVTAYRNSGYGYRVNERTSTNDTVWKIVRYPNYVSDTEPGTKDDSNLIYCLRAGVGFTANSSRYPNYTVNYDMKTEKTSVLNVMSGILASGGLTQEQIAIYNANYNKILWILDNIYVPGNSSSSDRETLLTNAGINSTNFPTITDEDIEVAQQLAIWYYTNFDNEVYNNPNFTTIYLGQNDNFQALADYGISGGIRKNAMENIFKYFITNADNKSNYESTNTPPITINNTVSCVEEGTNYKFGAYEITKNSNLPYTFTYNFNKSGIVLKDENGNTINNLQTAINNLAVGSTLKFYVYISTAAGMEGNLEFSYTTTYTTTEATFIITGADTANGEQPLVNVVKIPDEDKGKISVGIPKKQFDFSLRKFITQINGEDVSISREPVVDTTPLKNNGTTANYYHRKEPLSVKKGDIVTYTIRVYNEGELDGYVSEITDHLPEWLDFLPTDEMNIQYGWLIASGIGNRNIKTNITALNPTGVGQLQNDLYLSTRGADKLTKLSKYAGGDTLDYIDVKINCVVNDNVTKGIVITNIADITGMTDENGTAISADRDSTPANAPSLSGEALQNYTGKDRYTIEQLANSSNYYKGQEDDDDFEKLIVNPPEIDLALIKNIVKVNDVAQTERLTSIDVSKLNISTGAETTATYNMDKTPVLVQKGDIVTYRLRVYNEGLIDGYAKEITEDIPEGLEFLPEDAMNLQYGWEVTKRDSQGKITEISTDYLSKEKETTAGDNLLTAFGENDGSKTSDNLSSKEVYVRMKVVSENLVEEVIRNEACISEDSDKDGNDIDDRDSDPHRWVKYEDDEDYDNIVLKPFDLALRKFITKVNDEEYTGDKSRVPQVDTSKLNTVGTDGNVITTATYNHTKVPVDVKQNDIVVYTLRVYNEGSRDGYAAEIKDHLPEYLEFVSGTVDGINYGWEVSEDGRTVTTDYLSKENETATNKKIIKAAEKVTNPTRVEDTYNLYYRDVKIMCKVKTSARADEKITNIADITVYTDKDGNSIEDRDSEENNVVLPSDENLPNYKDDETGSYIPGQEDDDDFEKLRVKEFDLALRKFISQVNDKELTGDESRAPIVDTSKLNTIGTDGKLITTATYTHTKEPVEVRKNDIVIYTIRVYNEGEIDGYAAEIKDHLPEYLEYVDGEFNDGYGWSVSEDGRTITTRYLANKMINAAQWIPQQMQGNTGNSNLYALDHKDVQIMCKVKSTAIENEKITNIADITEYQDEDKNSIIDRDSEEDNVVLPDDKDLPEYIEHQEDDDDFEKLIIKPFDLALRKFITAVNNTPVNNRYPSLSYDEEAGKIVYNHTKEPVDVRNGNIVTYTIRVYNEGEVAGYAELVKDNIPEGLEFLPENSVNTQYEWKMYKVVETNGTREYVEVENVSDAEVIITDYLSQDKETSSRQNKLNPFNKAAGFSDENPDYRDVKVAFKVVEPNTSDRILINRAEIQEDSDDDIDSIPGEWNDGEDDQDIEKVKVKYFDLALKKWVSQAIVTENGKTTVTETGHTGDENPEPIVKVEIQSKKINKVTVKFRYKIKVINEGTIAGYAYELKDYIPEGLKFVAEDNPLWTDLGGGVISTRQLENTLLQPGETAEVEVLLTWINGADNMGLKINVAEISEDSDDDIDSVPDNKKWGEDDIDDAPVMLSVRTGDVRVYFLLTGIVLVTLAGGVILIKKFVL